MNVRRTVLLLVGLTVGGTAAAAAQQAEAPQVLLMTMGPGKLIHERFGHNAIWIRDTIAGRDLIYNFGMFDFEAPHFIWHFVQGRPEYWLDVWDLPLTMRQYQYAERQIDVQELALPAAQRIALAAALAENALPGNRSYRYDYFLDNCSTRIRDALDAALGGALRRQTIGQPAEGTFRWHTQRSITNTPGLYLGILAGLGSRVDQPLDQWDEMFLPAKVQERLRELRVVGDDGLEVPLVSREATLLPADRWQVAETRPDWSLPLFGIGMLVALVIASGAIPGTAGLPGRVMASGWAVLSTAGGVLLLFLWFGTNHVMTAANLNLLLLSPVAAALLPLLWSGRRRPLARKLALGYFALVELGSVLAILHIAQENKEIAALAAPIAVSAVLVALAVNRRRAAALPSPR